MVVLDEILIKKIVKKTNKLYTGSKKIVFDFLGNFCWVGKSNTFQASLSNYYLSNTVKVSCFPTQFENKLLFVKHG